MTNNKKHDIIYLLLRNLKFLIMCGYVGMVDNRDLKSLGRKAVPVRVRLPAPILIIMAVYPNGRGRGFKILTVWVRIPPQPPILINEP